MDVDHLITALIDREGGYVDHPADRGGATCWGVTQAVARAAGYGGAMAALPRSTAAAIYRRRYWLEPGLDRLAPVAPTLAAELFDTGVNMGPAVAAQFLYRALNVLNRGSRDYRDLPAGTKVDAAVVAAVAAVIARRGAEGERVLVRAVDALQGERYIHLAEQRPTNEAFVYGWLARRVGA